MDCVIVAGGTVPADDPLFVYTEGKPKALLKIGQQTMLERVFAAVAASAYVEDILVVGLAQSALDGLHFPRPPAASFPDQGGLVSNARVAFEWLRERHPQKREVLVSTGDIPLLTTAVVDAFIEDCLPFEHVIYYNLVTRQTMESRFPHSSRTFVRLKGREVAGGDLALLQMKVLETNEELWQALTHARKHAWQLARLVGVRTLLKLLTRQLSIAEIEQLASRMFAAPVRVLVSPHAELAMDVDKPQHVELLRREIDEIPSRDA